MSVMAEHPILKSRFPVDIPHFPELLITDAEFVSRLENIQKKLQDRKNHNSRTALKDNDSTSQTPQEQEEFPFIKALHQSSARVHTNQTLAAQNLTLTDNADVTNISSQDALVDLFYKLSEDVVQSQHLEDAWKCDALATVKTIFNARSIHLGKSNRVATYRAMGWLYKKHPMTFLVNLPWLVRPVIAKPKPKKVEKDKTSADDKSQTSKSTVIDAADDDEDDFVLVVPSQGASYDSMAHDRINGLAHGYWKDLLNMLALAAHDKFNLDADPIEILNVKQNNMGKRRHNKRSRTRSGTLEWQPNRIWDRNEARELKVLLRDQQHDAVTHKLNSHVVYQLFHVAVARLFANQLKRDQALLQSGNENDKSCISLAAKWAPSLKEFHDKNTWIASSIAEILFTHDEVCPANTPRSDRVTYLKHARMNYQFNVLSPLRKALDVVERKITAQNFKEISYAKVPSLAMQRYTKLFLAKDGDHFARFLDLVTSGKQKISGATLLPSVMISKVDIRQWRKSGPQPDGQTLAEQRVLDLQWKTLVQRIKDSGKIASSMAVCDVSGSMCGPQRPDGTTPMHAAIGLSLLLAEVCDAPFGGSMITFSEEPSVLQVGGAQDTRTLSEKVKYIMRSQWGMSTDFEAVFSKLILPLAIKHKIQPKDMVKQVFVFSDMQFNAARVSEVRWTTSFERIKPQFAKAGYEMPTLIFWNLASRAKGVPVTASEPGTALVSGYSQGSMKVFLDGGDFECPEADAASDDEVMLDGDGNEVKREKKEKRGIDAIQVMRRAISHAGYSMLRVVD